MIKEICKNCTHYRAYYHQRAGSYQKLNYGKCLIHKDDRKENEICEKYKYDELKEKNKRQAFIYI